MNKDKAHLEGVEMGFIGTTLVKLCETLNGQ